MGRTSRDLGVEMLAREGTAEGESKGPWPTMKASGVREEDGRDAIVIGEEENFHD